MFETPQHHFVHCATFVLSVVKTKNDMLIKYKS